MDNVITLKKDILVDMKDIGGTLCFYTLRQVTDFKPIMNYPVYWQDKYSPQGWGPFNSLYDAMKHHSTITKAMRAESRKPICNVIPVDFRNKKREV